MDLTLTRTRTDETGIYSILTDADGTTIAHTLEHAYDDGTGTFKPKIIDGTHLCVRGNHLLHGMTTPFSTFEITGVPGHSNLLFHWGNYNKDSDGCVLLGEAEVGDMVTNSRDTFEKFIALEAGLNEFNLTVVT